MNQKVLITLNPAMKYLGGRGLFQDDPAPYPQGRRDQWWEWKWCEWSSAHQISPIWTPMRDFVETCETALLLPLKKAVHHFLTVSESLKWPWSCSGGLWHFTKTRYVSFRFNSSPSCVHLCCFTYHISNISEVPLSSNNE